MSTGAYFSPDRVHLYTLWRMWDESRPHATLIGMNPSTADEVNNDPTVERWERRVRYHWERGKFGGVKVVNVFAYRETDSSLLPGLIRNGLDIIGPENNEMILNACRGAAIVVCAWGKLGHFPLDRGPAVLRLMVANNIKPHAFATNKDGSPKHALYVGYDVQPFEWR